MDTVTTRTGSYQAYQILHVAFAGLPIVAGLDKFLHLFAEWERYLAPVVANLVPIGTHTFMLGVGVVEMAAGALVAFKPSVGGWVVGLWLLGIVGNLLLMGSYLDIALRDLGLAFGAFALARMASDYGR